MKHEPPPIAALYLVECDVGPHGTEFAPCNRNASSFDQVVSDIVTGQYEDVIKVLEIFEDEGTCRDITEDVARACFERAEPEMDDEGNPTFGHYQDFLENQLGRERVERALGEVVS